MRDKILYLVISVLLASSCSREKPVPITIKPLQIDINGDVAELQAQLKERNTMLVYENSYAGEDAGTSLCYFNYEQDSLHYYFELFFIKDKLKGLVGSISSKLLSKERLFDKVEVEILPNYKETTEKLNDATIIKAERKMSEDVRGKAYYYGFEIKTKELQEKLK